MTTTAKITPSIAKTTRDILGVGYLSDSWVKTGTNVEDFFKILKALDAVTTFDKTFIKDIVFCSPYNHEEDSISFKCFTTPKPCGKRLSQNKFTAACLDMLYAELVKQRGCLLWEGGLGREKLCREKALRELMNTLGLSGSAIEKQSPRRDAYIAELIAQTPEKRQVTLVSRTEGDDTAAFTKVMAVRSDKYCPVPLTELETVFNAILDSDMGEVVCKRWYVDHDFAEIDIEFPAATKEFKELCGLDENIEAGVRLVTSGTGYSCVCAKETWRVKNTVSEHNIVKNKHIGKWSTEDFVKRVKENIFDEYAKLPERLCELFDVVILDSDDVKINGVPYAEKVLTDCAKEVFKYINLASAFKIKADDDKERRRNHVNRITELLVQSFSAEMQKAIANGENHIITAYDFALAVMTLPERVKDIPQSYMETFANLCGKAAYAPYSSEVKSAEAASEISFVA